MTQTGIIVLRNSQMYSSDDSQRHILYPNFVNIYQNIKSTSFSDITFYETFITTLWCGLWYGVWMWEREIYGEHNLNALIPFIIGFTPFLLWSLLDPLRGALYTIITTPLIVAPPIPHGFTQGVGDLFAIATVLGFLLHAPSPKSWLKLWRPEYYWLALIIVSAFLSILWSPALSQSLPYGIKYSFAETAGLLLAISYLMILVFFIKTQDDYKAVLFGMVSALLLVLIFSLISYYMIISCHGGYGGRTAFSNNLAVTSVFASSNYLASYLAIILPLTFYFYFKAKAIRPMRYFWYGIIVFVILTIEGTLSRAGLTALILVTFGCATLGLFEKGFRFLSYGVVFALSLTLFSWWLPVYSCIHLGKAHIVPENASSIKDTRNYVYTRDFTKPPKLVGHTERLPLLINSYHVWLDHPFTGVGIGLLANYPAENTEPNRAHNIVMTVLSEKGLIGLFAWAGWWCVLAFAFWKHRQDLKKLNNGFAFLGLSFLCMSLFALFMDYYRMLWIWQLSALIMAWPLVMKHSSHETLSN